MPTTKETGERARAAEAQARAVARAIASALPPDAGFAVITFERIGPRLLHVISSATRRTILEVLHDAIERVAEDEQRARYGRRF